MSEPGPWRPAHSRETETMNRCARFVKAPAGHTLTLDVGTMGTTVAAVKARIRDAQDIPPDRQRLAFASRPLLRDARTLEEYGIRIRSTLDV